MHTFFDLVPRRINEIVKELKNEYAPCIGYGEVLLEYFVESFIDPVFRSGLELEKLVKGF